MMFGYLKAKFPRELGLVFFIALAALSCTSLGAIAQDLPLQQAKKLKLWEDPKWQKLLHYRSSFWGYAKSDADGLDFFLSPNGKFEPEEELIENIKQLLLRDEPVKDQINTDPICRFPARREWLAQKLNVTLKFQAHSQCPKLQNFLEVAESKSISLIFSSYFLNSPSSAFGHSLLRLNRRELSDENETENPKLLDLGINYAAVMTSNNPLIYGWKGMTGGFKGVFSSVPYYYKVREYADFESRDLWEYDLNFTPEQTRYLALHLWELDSTYFDYYYLDENCSFHVLTVLDVIDPSLNLSEQAPFYVIPVDTIKIVTNTPGLVKRIRFRPSLRTQADLRIAQAPKEHFALIREIVANPMQMPKAYLDLDDAKKALVLDAALDLFDNKHQKTLLLEKNTPLHAQRSALLMTRSELSTNSQDITSTLPEDKRPDLGHDSFRWGLSYFTKSGSPGLVRDYGLSAEIRFAIHDRLDFYQGYPAYSDLEFFNLKLLFGQDPAKKSFVKPRLDEWTFITAQSYVPFNEFHGNKAWKIKMSMKDLSGSECENCRSSIFEGAWGRSVYLYTSGSDGGGSASSSSSGGSSASATHSTNSFSDGSNSNTSSSDRSTNIALVGYALLGGDLLMGGELKSGRSWGVGIGPTLGSILKVGDNFSAYLENRYLYRPMFNNPHFNTLKLEGRYHISNAFSFFASVETKSQGGAFAKLGFFNFF